MEGLKERVDDDDVNDGNVTCGVWCTGGDADTSSSCALLWKSVIDMLSSLLQSAGQDTYTAITSSVVGCWKLVSGRSQPSFVLQSLLICCYIC